MKIEIKSVEGKLLFDGDFSSVLGAVMHALKLGANLRGADMREAELLGADLRDADLRDAELGGARLVGANLRYARLGGARLRGANLRDARLGGANLRDARLSVADLGSAELLDADLRDADLRGADLRDANLRDADLRDADLRGADLRDAKLRDARLSSANLEGALGLVFAQVSFFGHGECGRMLTAIRDEDGEIRLFCGCFNGSVADLRKYIDEGKSRFRKTRTLALDTVLKLIDAKNDDEKKT